MFDLPGDSPERESFDENAALLVHLDISGTARAGDLSEFRSLATSAGAEVRGVVSGSRKAPDPRYFVGAGKAEEIRDLAEATGAELILVDHPLSPSQERNLERLIKRRVLDRTGLILDIFAQRARSHEGKLQVELAQLRHLSTRLVRGWTHLERQKGGIGLRGPGETQLETDRRLLATRIDQIRRRIDKVNNQREQGRQGRTRADVPTVSLVGYTNAGKSTLFNTLTGAEVYSADQLFATLDPTLRKWTVAPASDVVLADTVGFIQRLPHELVAAFRSTLQETVEADLLLHVVDASDPDHSMHRTQVDAVLDEIGAHDVPRILVFNKIDQMDMRPHADMDPGTETQRVWVSAHTGEGLETLADRVHHALRPHLVRARLEIPPTAGAARSRLFSLGEVMMDRVNDSGCFEMEVELPKDRWDRWAKANDAESFRVELVDNSRTGLKASGQ
ncbi:MAG: ribosome rescue GTPase HflX [Gammaproteobacteria bacterium]